jgi:hypothetical protein
MPAADRGDDLEHDTAEHSCADCKNHALSVSDTPQTPNTEKNRQNYFVVALRGNC